MPVNPQQGKPERDMRYTFAGSKETTKGQRAFLSAATVLFFVLAAGIAGFFIYLFFFMGR